MEQKIFLVTGGNKGIGKQIVKQIAEHGHRVYVGARNVGAGMNTATELQSAGDVRFVHLDLNNEQSIDDAVLFIDRDSGHLDGLVNNAGMIEGYENASKVSTSTLKNTFETNFYGTVMVTQKMLPLLRKGSHKTIVNVSTGLASMTMHGDPSWPFHSTTPFAYNASKAALNMFTVLLAKELRNEDFCVNSVSPGWVATDLGGRDAPRTVEQGAVIAVEMAVNKSSVQTGMFLTEGGMIPW
ncbi:SDR family NAD(P)-dependent oxidoreductase [Gynuella sunshinyii]|uniref:Dehydrogenases with different specificities (Related to short-chain alcohol dehydrogenase) n=1 Tax=Gynuella sunshinyii YC6258 TaxID=1445510 RepID=A0A0C5VWQ4_9GAMM|nr:SDR family NAD(P)-dependent oxidoreductase [Gynuella sunshinyii]AJQ94869.1 dehydrogenases with different specificities (related to short-chain alcohol dehydrogenase) [Gynuella sunshinyii YC6258]